MDNRKLLEELAGPLTFATNIRSLRLCEELTLAQFAQRLSVGVAHLSDVEHGRKGVSVERAARWAKSLGQPRVQFIQLAIEDQFARAELANVVVSVQEVG